MRLLKLLKKLVAQRMVRYLEMHQHNNNFKIKMVNNCSKTLSKE
jgi:hypothetical protein